MLIHNKPTTIRRDDIDSDTYVESVVEAHVHAKPMYANTLEVS